MPIPKRKKTISQEIDEIPNTFKVAFWLLAIWFVGLPLLGWTLLGLYILIVG